MTNHRAILKAIPAVLLVCSTGFAMASDTANMTVTASVQPICKFSTVSPLAFNIDPSDAVSQSGTVALLYKCTKGQAATISATGVGLTGRTLTGAGGTMTYDLTLGAMVASTGFSAANSVNITATVLAAQYADKAAGDYSETVPLTINP
jgi:spore coat protein U-like protein